MKTQKQKETLGNIKTAAKFVRIARTMLSKVRDTIAEDGIESKVVSRLDNYIGQLSAISDTIDDSVVEGFKTEQRMTGCQLALEFDE